jgi:DHA2 family multidrug resistance protein
MAVPIMVVTTGFIPKERMGNATSLFNMMRNIGGSVGISLVSTTLIRQAQQHTNLLVGNITPFSPLAQRLLAVGKGLFAASGPQWADLQAAAALFGLVQREATMVAMVRVFQLLAILSLILFPLIALTKRPPKGQAAQPVAH